MDKASKIYEQLEKYGIDSEIKDAMELNINLRNLRDLLDFQTYSYFKFEFEERKNFSLDFIVGLMRVYRCNNDI